MGGTVYIMTGPRPMGPLALTTRDLIGAQNDENPTYCGENMLSRRPFEICCLLVVFVYLMQGPTLLATLKSYFLADRAMRSTNRFLKQG